MRHLKEMRGKMSGPAFNAGNQSPAASALCKSRAHNYLVVGYTLLQIGALEKPSHGKDAVRDHVLKWLRLNKEFVTDTFRRVPYVDGT